MASKKVIQEAAKDFVQFIDRGPSPYHVVNECKKLLLAGGFTELKEKENHWKIQPLGKYFVITNFSTIIAFAIGGKYKADNGFTIVGAHTDSPCLRVKPHSSRSNVGYSGVGVQTYGGGIWHTWFDRDLKLAGRIILKGQCGLIHRLFHVEEPVLKIPNICIHLARDVHNSFAPNKETHMVPVMATSIKQQLVGVSTTAPSGSHAAGHNPVLISLLTKQLDCKAEDIMDFELCLADTQAATIGGALEEFIFAPRIDNLMNCYTGLQGLLKGMDSLESDTNVRMLALFDNEEVGSESAQGAMSSMFEWTLRRISAGSDNAMAFEEAIPKSFLISADQAHAVHPNYPEKHEACHRPTLHNGIVLKYNANQRYATTAITASVIREVASRCNVPLQEVVVRNDSSCGSTIGPMVSAKLGLRTVDLGTPQLSMHSIREMCCTTAVYQAIQLYKQFFESFPEIDETFSSV